jgi:hypothetical protein
MLAVLSVLVAATPAFAAQESLIEYAPDNAAAVVLFRKNGLALIRKQLDQNQQMQKELSQFLARALGCDLTRVEGMIAFSTDVNEKSPSFAAHLRVPGAGGSLKLPKRGAIEGVDLYDVSGVSVAVVPGGIIFGSGPDLRTAIQLALHKGHPLAAAPLGAALGADPATVDVAAGLWLAAISDKDASQMAQAYGIKLATFTIHASGQIGLSVQGDPQKLEQARQLLMTLVKARIDDLEKSKQKAQAGDNVVEGVTAIMTYYNAVQFLNEVQPRLTGDHLVMQYQIPKLEGSSVLVPMLGIGAAIAIPAMMKYARRSKTTEATTNVTKLVSAATLYREAHAKDGARFAFPATTPWTPQNGCCGQPSDRCAPVSDAFKHPTWKALSFSLDDPHYYQYRFTSTGKGPKAHFIVEARGDLDCDGIYSSFKREGSIASDGSVTITDLKTENETE